jgi:hypothetical protein
MKIHRLSSVVRGHFLGLCEEVVPVSDPLRSELAQVEQDVAKLRNVRGLMPDDQIEAALAPLRRKKADLEAKLAQIPGSSYQAEVKGSGTAVQGEGATAVGARGVNVSGGSVGGSIVTGQVKAKGDFIGRDRIEMSGDFRGATVSANAQLERVQQSLQDLPQTDDETLTELAQLVQQLQAALNQVPQEKQEEAEAVAAATLDLVDKAKAEKPNKTSIAISGEGLKKAAQNLAGVMPIVVNIASQIVDALSRYVVK